MTDEEFLLDAATQEDQPVPPAPAAPGPDFIGPPDPGPDLSFGAALGQLTEHAPAVGKVAASMVAPAGGAVLGARAAAALAPNFGRALAIHLGSDLGAAGGEYLNQQIGLTPESPGAIALAAAGNELPLLARGLKGAWRGARAAMHPQVGAALQADYADRLGHMLKEGKPTETYQSLMQGIHSIPGYMAEEAPWNYRQIMREADDLVAQRAATRAQAGPQDLRGRSFYRNPDLARSRFADWEMERDRKLLTPHPGEGKLANFLSTENAQRRFATLHDDLARRFGGTLEEGRGLQAQLAAHQPQEFATPEQLYGNLTKLNAALGEGGLNATPTMRYVLGQMKDATWDDLMQSPFGPMLQQANTLFKRERVYEEAETALLSAVKSAGQTVGVDPNQVKDKLMLLYRTDPRFQEVLDPAQYERWVNQAGEMGAELIAQGSKIGNLAEMGAVVGAGASVGGTVAGPFGGLMGGLSAMLGLREAQKRSAMQVLGDVRGQAGRALVRTIRDQSTQLPSFGAALAAQFPGQFMSQYARGQDPLSAHAPESEDETLRDLDLLLSQ